MLTSVPSSRRRFPEPQRRRYGYNSTMVTLARALEWRVKTPFYYGWVILGMAALGTFVGSGTSQDVMGGIQGFIHDDMGWSRREIALAASAGTWCAGAMAPFIGRLADRYGARWLLPIGAIIAGVSFLVLSEVHSLWQFYLFYIPGRAVANSVLMGVVPRTAAVNFFRRKRNTALALTAMSRPAGVAANIRIFSAIAGTYGWRGGYRTLALMTLSLVLPLMVLMRRRPEDMGLLPDGAKPREIAPQGQEEVGQGSVPGEANRETSSAGAETEFSWTVGRDLTHQGLLVHCHRRGPEYNELFGHRLQHSPVLARRGRYLPWRGH